MVYGSFPYHPATFHYINSSIEEKRMKQEQIKTETNAEQKILRKGLAQALTFKAPDSTVNNLVSAVYKANQRKELNDFNSSNLE